MVGVRRRFVLADIAQQVVGGFLFTGPFVVTEEVWMLVRSMSFAQTLLTLIVVLAVGYGALYKTDNRDPDRRYKVGGIPVRSISLISVPHLSVLVLTLAFDTPRTFLSDVSGKVPISVLGYEPDLVVLRITLEATSVGTVFSIISAATADSLF